MKTLGQNKALGKLAELRESFRKTVESEYEPNAKDCVTCDVQGSCCTDAHFVNVHISRLEAVAMEGVLNELEPAVLARVIERNRKAVNALGDSFLESYSCPLFEKGIGCLVHSIAKPLPCINHACYEKPSDLPPDQILEAAEREVNRLNDAVYKSNWNWMSIPVWLEKVLEILPAKNAK